MTIFKPWCGGGQNVIETSEAERKKPEAKRRSFKSMHRVKPVGSENIESFNEDNGGNIEDALSFKRIIEINKRAKEQMKKDQKLSFKKVAKFQKTMAPLHFNGSDYVQENNGPRKPSIFAFMKLALIGKKETPQKRKFITSQSVERAEMRAKLSFKSIANLHKASGLIIFKPKLKDMKSLTIDLEDDYDDLIGLSPKGKVVFKKLSQLNEAMKSIRFNKTHGVPNDDDSDIDLDPSDIEDNNGNGIEVANVVGAYEIDKKSMANQFLFSSKKSKISPEDIKKMVSVEKIDVKSSLDPLESYRRDKLKNGVKKIQHLKLSHGYKRHQKKFTSKKSFFQRVAQLPKNVKNWKAYGCCFRLREQIKIVEKIIMDAKDIARVAETELLDILPEAKARLPKDLSHSVIDQLKSIRISPPQAIQVLLGAVCVLKRIKPLPIYSDNKRKQVVGLDYWTPSRRILAGNFYEELHEMKVPGVITRTGLEDFKDVIKTNPEFNKKKIKKAYSPLTAMYHWLLKIEKYADIAVLVKEKEDIRQLAERTIKKGKISIEKMKERLNKTYA